MDKQYPIDENVLFLICDAIRKEPNNKLSLLGTFLGGDILVENDAPITLQSLAMLFHLSDGHGKFDSKFQVLKEDGEELLTIDGQPVIKDENSGNSIGLTVTPMKFEEFGHYTFRLILDDRNYDRQIYVHKSQLAGNN